MSYNTLKALVNSKIYENTEQRITGGDMNDVLQSAIASLGAHYQMGGLVSPTDHITVGDEPVVFIATTPGTYTYFGSQVVADGEVALLVWSGTAWSKQTPDISTRTEVNQLGQQIRDITTDKFGVVRGYVTGGQWEMTSQGNVYSRYVKIKNGDTIVITPSSHKSYCKALVSIDTSIVPQFAFGGITEPTTQTTINASADGYFVWLDDYEQEGWTPEDVTINGVSYKDIEPCIYSRVRVLETYNKDLVDIVERDSGVFRGYVSDSGGGNYSWAFTDNGNVYSIYVKIFKGDKIIITPSSHQAYFKFLNSLDYSTTPNFAFGAVSNSATPIEIVSPDDCFLLFLRNYEDENWLPSDVTINGVSYMTLNQSLVSKVNDIDNLLSRHIEKGKIRGYVNSELEWSMIDEGNVYSSYINVYKDDIVKIIPNNHNTYCKFLKSINTNESPVLAFGTISEQSSPTYFKVTSDCYFVWLDDYEQQGWTPEDVLINRVSYKDIEKCVLDRLDDIENELNDKNVDLIMFMGQSNMAGRGATNSTFPQGAPLVPIGSAFEFRAISDPTKLYDVVEPFGLHENVPGAIDDGNSKTGSLVSAFVNSYYGTCRKKIVGVSASEGGTSITTWQPNGAKLNDAINRLSLATSWLIANGYKIEHKYMAWCQGETDGDHNMSESDYTTYFTNMLNAMMEEGIEKCFLIRIGEYNGPQAIDYNTIITTQNNICKNNENVVMVSTAFASFKEKGLMKDYWHYYQEGYNRVGDNAGANSAMYRIGRKEPIMYDCKTNSLFFTDESY